MSESKNFKLQNNNDDVLDLSKRANSPATRKTPSPAHSTSSLGSICSTQYGSLYDPIPPSSSPTTMMHSPSYGISPGQMFSMYCQNIREQNGQAPNLRDFVESVSDPRIPSEKLDQLTKNILQTYPLPPQATYHDRKLSRPFKCLPRDPEQIPAHFAACDLLKPNPLKQVESYMEFRKRALEEIRVANGGHRTTTNPKMRRMNSGNGRGDQLSDESRSDNESYNTTNQENKDNSSNENDTTSSTTNGIVKDAAYYERRRKNNAAAKKSRDRRRLKEDELTIRNEFLQRQNIELNSKIDTQTIQLEALKTREVQLLCERKTFEARETEYHQAFETFKTREAELRQVFEARETELRLAFERRETELLQQLKSLEMRHNQLLHENDVLKSQNDDFYKSRESRLHIQSVH